MTEKWQCKWAQQSLTIFNFLYHRLVDVNTDQALFKTDNDRWWFKSFDIRCWFCVQKSICVEDFQGNYIVYNFKNFLRIHFSWFQTRLSRKKTARLPLESPRFHFFSHNDLLFMFIHQPAKITRYHQALPWTDQSSSYLWNINGLEFPFIW